LGCALAKTTDIKGSPLSEDRSEVLTPVAIVSMADDVFPCAPSGEWFIDHDGCCAEVHTDRQFHYAEFVTRKIAANKMDKQIQAIKQRLASSCTGCFGE
jgi:hypothetical protein